MTVFVQPQTSVDGAALGAWIEKHGVELRWCSDERYRHGKLVEWQIAGQREALTGSPNLSTGALLRGIGPQSDPGVSGSARGSANLELGTITPIPNSLAPAVAEPPRGGLSGVEFRSDPADADGPKVLLLGATAMGDSTVELRLASELLEKARVQVHDPIRDWTSVPIDELLPGKSSYRIASTELGAGRALRLLGPEDASNEVFISDPLRARRRPFRRIGPDVSEPPDLVEEGGLTALFEIAELMRPVLLRLGVLTPRSKSPTGDVPSDTPVGEEPSDDAEDERLVPAAGQTLSDYLAACAAVLNETSVEWALALPTLPGLPDDSLEARGGLLTDETDDSAADAGKKAAQQGSRTLSKTVRNLSEKRRAQLRRFCEKALTLVSKWPNLMRAYTARLTLTGIAAELWSTEDERREVLVALVDGLTSSGDEPTDEERRALAAYAAVALAFLRMDIDRLSVSTEPTLKFRAASEKVRPILASFDPTRLETVLQELEHDSQPSLTAIEVEELAEQTRNPLNAIDRAIDLLRTEDEIEAHSEDGVLVLDDPLPRGFQRELLRITGVVGGPRAAVFGTTLAGIDVMCAWDKPRLVIAQRSKIGFGGHLYELQHSTPAGIAASWDHGRGMSDNLPRRVVDWTPGRPPPEAVAEILRATGLESNDSE